MEGSVRVLLTGGAGYVGSACLRELLRGGHDAIAYDDLSSGHAEAVPEGRLIVGDIFDAARLDGALRDHASEAVLHFAALASVSDSQRDPAGYYRVNVAGTQNVLEAVRRSSARRFVLSSTAGTYASDAPPPLGEDSPQRPDHVYGRSKLAAEWIARDYCAAYGIGCAILRYFNAAGADASGDFGEDRERETHLIPNVFGALLGRQPLLCVYGSDWPTPDGTCVRDYVHTDDLASAHQLVLESLAPEQLRIYNLGTGRGHSVREVLAACEQVAGRSAAWEFAPRRPGDPPVLVAHAGRIERELGWRPRYREIRSIAATAWEWHRRHPEGFRSKPSARVRPAQARPPSEHGAPAPEPPHPYGRGRAS
jgi:UDP-glucose 4-epimerase